eukprot:5678451-Amphidinium_carterae.1
MDCERSSPNLIGRLVGTPWKAWMPLPGAVGIALVPTVVYADPVGDDLPPKPVDVGLGRARHLYIRKEVEF